MLGMRNFRYWYTAKIIPYYRYTDQTIQSLLANNPIWKSKRYNKLDIEWNTSWLQLALL